MVARDTRTKVDESRVLREPRGGYVVRERRKRRILKSGRKKSGGREGKGGRHKREPVEGKARK